MNDLLIKRLNEALEGEADITITEDAAKAVLEYLFEWMPVDTVPKDEDVLVLGLDIQKAIYHSGQSFKNCLGSSLYTHNPVGWFPLPFAKYKP